MPEWSLRREVNIELNFPPKLRGARSRLYRRQILQVNIRWKALDESFKIYMLLHRSDLNISESFRQKIPHFWQNFAKIRYFLFFSLISAQILMKFCRNFADNLENVEIILKLLNFLGKIPILKEFE